MQQIKTINGKTKIYKPKKKYKENLVGYLFILPVIIGVLFFIAYPLVYSLISTFKNWNGLIPLGKAKWVKFEMYQRVLTDRAFWDSLLTTIITLIGIPIGMILSMGLAMLLNRGLKGTNTFRVIFYIPAIVSISAIIILWRGMLAVDGPLNAIFGIFGMKAKNWLGEPVYARISLIGMLVWKGLGVSTLLYIAGLQGISGSYLEAAKLDGANSFQIFTRIIFPLLKPTHFYMVVTGIINGMQLYIEPDLLLNGGPANSTRTVLIYLFQRFDNRLISEASVVAWILALIVFVVTALQFYMNSRSEKR
ncbi:MAG: sugar ABC transporter permease [Acholeplasmataceae bacterium]|jgi:multiple sugar transport system permease protein|nr:sugar ABC transporter permease [Acholeplasmataceae bacterium]